MHNHEQVLEQNLKKYLDPLNEMRISRSRQKRNFKSIDKIKSEAKSIDNLQFENAILATNNNEFSNT